MLFHRIWHNNCINGRKLSDYVTTITRKNVMNVFSDNTYCVQSMHHAPTQWHFVSVEQVMIVNIIGNL